MMARKVMGALVAGAMGTTSAMADVYADSVLQQLEAEGFRSISTERTWLGRMRIVAESGNGQREIIINPNNGEVLRDLWLVDRREGGDGANGKTGMTAASLAGSGDQDDSDDENSDDSDDRNDDSDRSRSGSDGGRDGADGSSGDGSGDD